MRSLLIITFFFTVYQATAQNEWFNSEAFWKTVKQETTLPPEGLSATDTAIVVASSRKPQDGLRFMSEARDGDSVRYFFVYTHNKEWHILPTPSLEKAISYMPQPDRDWVVYTEGMGKIFTSDLFRALQMAGQYDVNVLLLDYPSISTSKGRLGNYFFAIKNARVAYKDFVPVFAQVKELRRINKMGSGKLTLFFHSMGNNVVKELVENDKLNILNSTTWADNIVLNAPCVAQKKHKNWLKKIDFGKNVYVHYNPEDHVLSGAHLVSFHKQLGEKVRNPICRNVNYINFNSVAGERHSNFLSLPDHAPAVPEAIAHYKIVLHGDEAPLRDSTLYYPTSYRGIGYDLLPMTND